MTARAHKFAASSTTLLLWREQQRNTNSLLNSLLAAISQVKIEGSAR